MAHSPKSVRHLLKDKPTLKILELEISAQKALLAELRRLLPGELADHCVAAQQRGPQLVLHVDSPVWATRLRFLAPGLLELLRPENPGLHDIRFKLLVPRAERRAQPRPARRSDAGAAIIHQSAADTKHPALREALERLSLTLKRKE
jgi:hypothetical protein